MTRLPIFAVPLPPASRLATTPANYTDAYQASLPAGTFQDAASAARQLFGQAPAWVRHLLRLRDWLVRPLRLTTFPGAARPAVVGALPVAGGQLGLFHVFSVSPREVVLGLDDRHLDFRVSVLLADSGAVVVSTLVWFHHWLGRLYFAVVRPFHHLIVPALLRYAGRRLPQPPAAP